jgi:hypothetical protein
VDDPAPRSLPDQRASDADRERVAAALTRAGGDGRLDVEELEERLQLAYAARTHADLEALLADLGADASDAAGTAVGPRVVPGASGGTAWVVSIMSGSDRAGRWRLAERCTVLNIMGGSDLDLCDAELTDRVTELRVYSLMGGSDINVPEGLDVQVSKFALMGGHDVDLGDHVPPPGSPVLRVRMIALMGGGNIRRGRKLGRRRRRDGHELHR